MRWWLLPIGLALLMTAPGVPAMGDSGPTEPSLVVVADGPVAPLEPGGAPGTWNASITY